MSLVETLRRITIFNNRQEISKHARKGRSIDDALRGKAVRVLAPHTNLPIEEIREYLKGQYYIKSDQELKETISQIEQKRQELALSS